jgi:hypothetical protein
LTSSNAQPHTGVHVGCSIDRPLVLIAEPVLRLSEQLLRQRRAWRNHERVVYWAGFEIENRWIVTTVIRPQSQTTWGSFRTSAKANAEVVAYLSSTTLGLLGQVHTHPGESVDHSDGDDEMAVVAFENFLSIVVPHYGTRGMLPLQKCGIHRFESDQFRRLQATEISSSVRILTLLKDFEGQK